MANLCHVEFVSPEEKAKLLKKAQTLMEEAMQTLWDSDCTQTVNTVIALSRLLDDVDKQSCMCVNILCAGRQLHHTIEAYDGLAINDKERLEHDEAAAKATRVMEEKHKLMDIVRNNGLDIQNEAQVGEAIASLSARATAIQNTIGSKLALQEAAALDEMVNKFDRDAGGGSDGVWWAQKVTSTQRLPSVLKIAQETLMKHSSEFFESSAEQAQKCCATHKEACSKYEHKIDEDLVKKGGSSLQALSQQLHRVYDRGLALVHAK